MIILLLVIHILIAIALVGVILLQKSEGGALGMGGGGMSGFMTGRSTANLLTRTTAILALLFFATSLSLVWFSNRGRAPRSIIEQGAPAVPVAPSTPAAPAAPSAPAAPAAPPPQPTPAVPAQPSPPLSR
jgi:preprotein translocase subunit SecG